MTGAVIGTMCAIGTMTFCLGYMVGAMVARWALEKYFDI